MVTSVNNNIKVTSGVRLTVLGRLNMGEGTHIKVEKGGELLVDGGTITNECGLTWQGIYVNGDAVASQTGTFPTNPQGKVVLKNGATIEHAIDAISTQELNVVNSGGGIIEADDAIFRNNKRDIEFFELKLLASASYFNNCDFFIDADCRFTSLNPRVTMWAIGDVHFRGCDFEIQHPSFLYQGDGIFTIDAGFVAESFCTGVYNPNGCITIPSTFKNLNNGIHATKSKGVMTFTADECVFDSNIIGVKVNGVDNLQITRNTINIGGAYPVAGNINRGVVIETSSGYRIEENTFTGSSFFQPFTYGTYLYNTGPDENEVYKNTFLNLIAANVSWGTNRDVTAPSPYLSTGLQYLCNTQTNNDYDIVVGTGDGIRTFQGFAPTAQNRNYISAENTFSNNGTPESDFYNLSSFNVYPVYNPVNMATYANDFTPGKVIQIQGYPNSCPSKIGGTSSGRLGSGGRDSLIQQFYVHNREYQNLSYVYLSLIDGGDSKELKENITYEWSRDAWKMRDNLLAQSPNLSLVALWEAAKTGVLPDAMLMEVLVANIGTCQQEEFFIALVNEIPNPLPQEMVDLLKGAPESPSLRKTLEEKLATHSSMASNAANLIIHDLLRDDSPNMDTLRQWYSNLGGLNAAYLVAETYLEAGDIATAKRLMSGLASQYAYAEAYPDHYRAYVQMFDLKVLLSESGRNWKDLTKAEIQALEVLADGDKGKASVQAQNVLRFFYGHTYEMPLFIPDGTVSQPVENTSNQLLVSPFVEMKAYPNPARDYLTFEYHYPAEEEGVQITIVDITGRVIQQFELSDSSGQLLWDTRGVVQGTYLYTLKSKGKVLKSGKIAIIK